MKMLLSLTLDLIIISQMLAILDMTRPVRVNRASFKVGESFTSHKS
jgi:hypothetical protein